MKIRNASPFSPTLPTLASHRVRRESAPRARHLTAANDQQRSAAETAEVIVKELERRTERHGPLRPELAVHWVRSAASALRRAEQNGEIVDGGACVFWLGAVLFYALTGKAPLGPLPGVLSPAVPPPASSLSRHPVSSSLDSIISKCMARRRTDRFASITELHIALSAVLFNETSTLLQQQSEAA